MRALHSILTARRALAPTAALALSVGLVWSTAPAAAAATVTTSERVLTRQVVPAKGSYTLALSSLPAGATSATLTVAGADGAANTDVSVCGGSAVTSSCTSTWRLPVPAGQTVFGRVTVPVGPDKKVTVFSSASTVKVTLKMTSYGTAATAVQSAATTGRPSAANTGVPAGKALTVHEGDLKITKENTVIDSMEIRGVVWVQAPGVIIRNSKITGRTVTSDVALIMMNSSTASLTVSDSEIYARYPSYHIRGIIGSNFTLTRVNVHDVVDQMVITGDNVTVQNSYLHGNLHYATDPNYGNKPTHDDNIQVSMGSNLKFVYNTLEGSHTAALIVTQDRGIVRNVLVANNWVSNGGCSLNLAQKSYGALQGFVIKNNVFTRTQAFTGCAAIVDSATIPLLSLSNNTWADGKPIGITPRG